MRPTLRGLTALVIVVLAFAASLHAGPRSLNAIVAPLVVVLVAAVAIVGLRSRPAVDRAPVEPGFPGDRRTVSLTLESDGATGATIRDRIGDGLELVDGSDPVFETTLEAGRRLTYEVDLTARGVHELGPLSVVVTDVFGLVTRRFDREETMTVLVYPRVASLGSGVRRDLRTSLARVAGSGAGHEDGREEFDHVRAYQRGDPLGDVHWKASAKRPGGDLLVSERTSTDSTGAVTVALEGVTDDETRAGTAETIDDFASVAAAVVDECLESGVRVGLVAGGDRLEPGAGPEHYRDLLAVLARWEGEPLEGGAGSDSEVVIRATDSGPVVAVGGSEVLVDPTGQSDEPDTGAIEGARVGDSGPSESGVSP
ncbi:DUF58 domain-containing protein [Natrarchaeobaculum aegyptiacum]|uniref:Uncharacterized protein n=1 Tax=Natrarchaeobaculum aegyptiacum TaxID=745377 RepID=A0A2Z2HVJ1_9EURY|nr:DUF58 domain-containing protein [Natrarchaeobaculum aegyptiacum]ARS89054.1 hypothetical protein B1756_04305 [Natrarchaeobaculum aegyptiacum]